MKLLLQVLIITILPAIFFAGCSKDTESADEINSLLDDFNNGSEESGPVVSVSEEEAAPTQTNENEEEEEVVADEDDNDQVTTQSYSFNSFTGKCDDIVGLDRPDSLTQCAALENFNFDNVNLRARGLKLHGADIRSADLSNAKVGLFRIVNQEIIFDETTVFPTRIENNRTEKLKKAYQRAMWSNLKKVVRLSSSITSLEKILYLRSNYDWSLNEKRIERINAKIEAKKVKIRDTLAKISRLKVKYSAL